MASALAREDRIRAGVRPAAPARRPPPRRRRGFYPCRRPAVQGLRRGRAVRRDSAGGRTARDRPAARRCRHRPRRNSFRIALWVTRRRARRLQGGRYRFDRAAVAARGHRQARARRRVRPADHVPRRAQIATDGRALREQGFGPAADFIPAAATNAALVQRDRSRREGSRGLSVSRHLQAAAPRDRGAARRAHGGEFHEGARRRTGRRRRRARADRPSARDPRVDRREGDRAIPTSVRWSRRCTPTGSGSAWGCSAIRPSSTRWSGRAATTGNLRAKNCSSTRPTTPTGIRACRPGRSRRPAARRSTAAASPADVPYLYFVSKNDGTHAFATTLDEHNRNVQQYQVQYFRDQRQKR